ncbi:TRAM domain-containing protein [Candidatus Nitrosotenuis aquarius]|uniref:TRAM domain-containing protein n=1 Tax=Candidatus Nitrosotenuis aquarius TaxID=1846278 RepID=UPI001FE69B73|nr:TRAM domain-containing protein [Candidatus Nitrosotenuis aquarius]
MHEFICNISYMDFDEGHKESGGVKMSFDDNSGRRDNRRFGGGYRGGGGGRRFNNDRQFDDRPKPVETGKEYDVSITETSRQGDGIARVDGFVIFVKGGQPGQETKIKVTQVGRRFATAELAQ